MRENTDQENTEYGLFLSSVNVSKILSIVQEFRVYLSLCIAAGESVLRWKQKQIMSICQFIN